MAQSLCKYEHTPVVGSHTCRELTHMYPKNHILSRAKCDVGYCLHYKMGVWISPHCTASRPHSCHTSSMHAMHISSMHATSLPGRPHLFYACHLSSMRATSLPCIPIFSVDPPIPPYAFYVSHTSAVHRPTTSFPCMP